jgi:hypothetical protein
MAHSKQTGASGRVRLRGSGLTADQDHTGAVSDTRLNMWEPMEGFEQPQAPAAAYKPDGVSRSSSDNGDMPTSAILLMAQSLGDASNRHISRGRGSSNNRGMDDQLDDSRPWNVIPEQGGRWAGEHKACLAWDSFHALPGETLHSRGVGRNLRQSVQQRGRSGSRGRVPEVKGGVPVGQAFCKGTSREGVQKTPAKGSWNAENEHGLQSMVQGIEGLSVVCDGALPLAPAPAQSGGKVRHHHCSMDVAAFACGFALFAGSSCKFSRRPAHAWRDGSERILQCLQPRRWTAARSSVAGAGTAAPQFPQCHSSPDQIFSAAANICFMSCEPLRLRVASSTKLRSVTAHASTRTRVASSTKLRSVTAHASARAKATSSSQDTSPSPSESFHAPRALSSDDVPAATGGARKQPSPRRHGHSDGRCQWGDIELPSPPTRPIDATVEEPESTGTRPPPTILELPRNRTGPQRRDCGEQKRLGRGRAEQRPQQSSQWPWNTESRNAPVRETARGVASTGASRTSRTDVVCALHLCTSGFVHSLFCALRFVHFCRVCLCF